MLPPLYKLKVIPDDILKQPNLLMIVLKRVPEKCLSRVDFERITPYMTPAVMAYLAEHQDQAISGLRRFSAEVITVALETCNYLFIDLLKKKQHQSQGVFPEDFTEDQLLRVLYHVPSALRYIPAPTEQMCVEALESDPTVIDCIDAPSEAMMQRAVELDAGVIARIQEPPRQLVCDTLSVYPDLLLNDGFIPRTIDAHSVDFYEAALGRKLNHTLLYPNVRPKARVTVPVDAVMDPASKQLECLARTVRALDQYSARRQADSPYRFNARIDTPDSYRLITEFLIPCLNALPLGKKYRDEWRRQDDNGLWLLEWLRPLHQHAHGLSQDFTLSVNAQFRLDRLLDRMARQIEMGIGATQAASPAPEPRDMTDTL